MKKLNLILIFLLLLLQPLLAQEQVQMADTMRSEGKIYVVVAIIVLIFTGLAVYLFSMDRKITRTEKKLGK